MTSCRPRRRTCCARLLATFINALMPAEADAVCGAPYGMPGPDRVNVRNGYRHRDFDTRAGTLDVAIPKLRSGSYFPDWLLERRRWATRSMRGSTGRPAIRRNIKALALRLARENTEGGYHRIHGELAGLGVKVAAPTVWEILKASGAGPAPLRRTGPAWPQFLRSEAEAILACDFFTAGLPDGTQAHVLAVIEHAARRIPILGLTLHPTGEWATQHARNPLMDLGGPVPPEYSIMWSELLVRPQV
jgi:hypothetical protein